MNMKHKNFNRDFKALYSNTHRFSVLRYLKLNIQKIGTYCMIFHTYFLVNENI